jgi:hypothetical protein
VPGSDRGGAAALRRQRASAARRSLRRAGSLGDHAEEPALDAQHGGAAAVRQRTYIDIPIPCSFDFNLAATKYFDGLASDDIPLLFLFSGTVFCSAPPDEALQATPISWEKEARFRLPVGTWRELMDHYHPNGSWLRLHRDTFERLAAFKRSHGIASWDEALERLLPAPGTEIRS